VHGREVEEGGYAGPSECTEDAGERGDDIDEREHGVAHAKCGFGEEHGRSRYGGYAV
jgi:hypothetical protein